MPVNVTWLVKENEMQLAVVEHGGEVGSARSAADSAGEPVQHSASSTHPLKIALTSERVLAPAAGRWRA